MTIDNYLKEFPALKKPTGYLLLLKDFEFLYPENYNGFIESFATYKTQIFQLAAKRTGRDKCVQNLLSLEKTSEDSSNLGALLSIPSLLSVNTFKLKGATKKVWRPSKAEVREAFITHVKTDAEICEAVSARKHRLEEYNLTLQPFIIAVGESLNSVKSYFVIVNDHRYFIPTIVEAVDACIKIIFTLNAKYPEECSCTWMFIQNGFYKIKTRYDKTSTATNTLLSELGMTE
ncbi:uncharacterized protein LOC129952043 isoform X1 [Eupeodes corollae]|uniref:uncharacterized protein LOC129952043 isoform X1 n=1 Tax=Eupeodes corollae TaxID=290404 RepID=UPI0024909C2A|nr:uncharacterized protein LOC129952043 isoform X1 [Eupeodes corollae]